LPQFRNWGKLRLGAQQSFAVKEHKLKLITEIYDKCVNYFDKSINDVMFLSIITSSLPLFNKYYPEFISKYSSDTNMITDSTFYVMEHRNSNLHLQSFARNPQIVKYRPILKTIQRKKTKIYSNMFTKSEQALMPNITFMASYVKFSNYPQDYNWLLEFIRPQPSPFVETITKEIYKTWAGEAIINFKWNTYGKVYYMCIWMLFSIYFLIFTIVATAPQQYFDKSVRDSLLIMSIFLGYFHLSIEIRQFIYNPNKWIHNYWNFFGRNK